MDRQNQMELDSDSDRQPDRIRRDETESYNFTQIQAALYVTIQNDTELSRIRQDQTESQNGTDNQSKPGRIT